MVGMSQELLDLHATDPAGLPYPPTLPWEIALRHRPVQMVCASYGIGYEKWQQLRGDARFVEDLKHAIDQLKKDGMTFKIKARLQAEELLKTMWHMIHESYDLVPASVKADLSKFIVNVAGLNEGKKQDAERVAAQNNLQINLVLGP